ncbi:hypothetical protein BDV06DRAFT_81909 [Aspergillus oleicola]
MSRPALSSAARRLSRSRTIVSISSPASSTSTPSPSFSASRSICHSSYRTSTPTSTIATPRQNIRSQSTVYRAPRSCLYATPPRSSFSTSARLRAAQVTQNPRTGEDGETLMVGISERAANVGSTFLSFRVI